MDPNCTKDRAGSYLCNSDLVSIFLDTLLELSAFVLTLSFLKYAVGFLIVFVLWYYLFWRPFDLYRDFTDLGFQEANRKHPGKGNDIKRKHFINELRQRRKVGEIPPPYPNGWFVVLETRDLPKHGSREISCLGLNLVAWRGESGKSYVADAYCPHLGAHLGVNGEVNGECIKCPFHGWSFEGEKGKCVNIPYSDSVPEFAKIKIWKTVEFNGYIYLWYHAEGEEPTWFPEPIPEVASGKWKYRGRSEFRVACHIQEVQENGADLSHLNIVHKSAMLTGGTPSDSLIKWGFLEHVWTGGWEANSDPKLAHRALMTLSHEILLFNKFPFLKVNVHAHQLGPAIVYLKFQLLGGEGVLFFMVTPLEPLLVKITHSYYSCSSLIQHPIGLTILKGEAIQLERDIGIWNRKTFISKPLLTKEDRAIKSFRRWFNQFYSENSPKYNKTNSTMDLSF